MISPLQRNSSLTNAKSLTTATAEASSSVQAEFASMTEAISATEKDYQNNNEEIMQKMKADKARALEEINVAGQEAAKATANLRSDAEAFTQKAKDQWTDHYQRVEIALREKSDKSNSHVSALQEKTGDDNDFYHYIHSVQKRKVYSHLRNISWKQLTV